MGSSYLYAHNEPFLSSAVIAASGREDRSVLKLSLQHNSTSFTPANLQLFQGQVMVPACLVGFFVSFSSASILSRLKLGLGLGQGMAEGAGVWVAPAAPRRGSQKAIFGGCHCSAACAGLCPPLVTGPRKDRAAGAAPEGAARPAGMLQLPPPGLGLACKSGTGTEP